MVKEIALDNVTIKYELIRKSVKNINLSVKSDGSVRVSASRWVSERTVEGFVKSKADFILKAQKKYEQRAKIPKKQYFNESEIREVILGFCREVYPYFKDRGVDFPEIKFRKMVSRWGSCNVKKKVLTFNTALMYAPKECIKFVVYHEFTHFLEPNHSKAFHKELQKVCPNEKELSKRLKEINLK